VLSFVCGRREEGAVVWYEQGVRRLGCIRQPIAAVRRVGAVHNIAVVDFLTDGEVDVAVDLLELRNLGGRRAFIGQSK
jgi:hypothetical protein